MFKDYEKYLSTSLKVYIFVLVILFILKLVGLDYFGITTDNNIIKTINNICEHYNLTNIVYFIGLMIYQYLMMSIICVDNSKKLKKFTIITIPFTAILHYYKNLHISNPIFYILEFIYLIILCKIYKKDVKIKSIIKVLLIIFVLQAISNVIRNNNNIKYVKDFIRNLILNLDYFFMLLIYQKIALKGGLICQDLVGSYSQMKANLKKSLTLLLKNLHNFKYKSKKEKIATIIYFGLSFIWNTLSILLVLLVARLNHTFIECIFILTSFWLSKHTFGKAFHLKSMAQCFIVSNATYYVLNRLTTHLGISILVPIMLGVGLSYVTSKLVKKIYKPLYRGMPKDIFEETILKVVDKDSDKYKICYDFFIEKKSAISLSMKYNYSEAGIRQITKRVNDKIKELK